MLANTGTIKLYVLLSIHIPDLQEVLILDAGQWFNSDTIFLPIAVIFPKTSILNSF